VGAVTSWAKFPDAKDKGSIPIQLGPVGGRIVAEVFAAILKADPTSYLNAAAPFSPLDDFSHTSCETSTFGLAELLNVVLGRRP
jgi:hypothetical protein